ncbi:MAG: hypothetical protein QOD31_3774, partial [Pseudonocardiales bacterium]|nr:hypothetical protein [Pseudonocardiales bacterium]
SWPTFAVFDCDVEARCPLGGLSYSQQRRYVDGIESAKKSETRERLRPGAGRT